jgi:transglutaminase-like putative cysteine protease
VASADSVQQPGGEPAAPPGGPSGGPADGGTPPRVHQRILRSKGFVPTAVMAGLLVVILLSSRLSGRPPQVDSITPSTAKPGDVLIITGRYFGQKRNTAQVRISGIAPTSSEYGEWSDTRISLSVPDEANSGLVYVITPNGRSRGLLFINREQIPVLAPGAAKPGEPWVNSIAPPAARVGETITVSGMNFGLQKGSSEVYFSWAAGGAGIQESGFDVASLLPARQYNLDYVSWSDREIVLRVPDGASSGNVLVTSDKGRSNSVYFEVLGGAGTKFFSTPRKYAVEYGLELGVAAAVGENALFVWMPTVIQTPEQRKIQLVSQEPAPAFDPGNGAVLFSFANLRKGDAHRVRMSWLFDRYSVETQVTPSKVPPYATASDLYRTFTAPDALVPSTNPEIAKAAAAAAGAEKNPYLRARRLYDWLLGQLTWSATVRDGDAVLAARMKRADAFGYASLYCALLRATGIPARIVSGVIVDEAGRPGARHFWNEFYLETVGWIPVDPLLGDERSLVPGSPGPDMDTRAYYFGSLDNRHLTFSKGMAEVSRASPDGTTRRRRDFPWLLTFHEESVGDITGYTNSFQDVTVTGTY